jgi:hypothetical protein
MLLERLYRELSVTQGCFLMPSLITVVRKRVQYCRNTRANSSNKALDGSGIAGIEEDKEDI